MVHKCLVSLERLLRSKEEVKEMHCDVINRHIAQGYVTEVPREKNKGGWYLPHFPVTQMDAATTKVCVVFDAAAKCDGSSLNTYLKAGPKPQ